MKIMECTIRDRENVLRNGFPAGLTDMILRGFTENGITVIELILGYTECHSAFLKTFKTAAEELAGKRSHCLSIL